MNLSTVYYGGNKTVNGKALTKVMLSNWLREIT